VLNWELQRSPGYIENIGYISLGNNAWMFHQLLNGQGNQERQELQLKLNVTGPSGTNFGFDFQHKVRHKPPSKCYLIF
jgi:hypothetical protein